jgi:hypothetical protein
MENLTENKILKVINSGENLLISTHSKLSLPILNRIYKKMMNGILFDDIKVCDNLIIDGPHRYVSSLCAGVAIGKVKSSTTSATKEYDWSDVEFVEEEWDTERKIRNLNELDAKYNDTTVEEIIKMIE